VAQIITLFVFKATIFAMAKKYSKIQNYLAKNILNLSRVAGKICAF
jgi:hypothetical protein